MSLLLADSDDLVTRSDYFEGTAFILKAGINENSLSNTTLNGGDTLLEKWLRNRATLPVWSGERPRCEPVRERGFHLGKPFDESCTLCSKTCTG